MPFLLLPIWFSLVLGAGWLFFPISRRIFGDVFLDGGLAAGRILFLGFWTLAAFWLGQIGVPTAVSAWLYAVFAAVGLFLWRRDAGEIIPDLTAKKHAIYSVEALFLCVFLLFFLLRGFWSDTNGNNGEKGMDGALIAALARADRLPPPNPYAAGARLQGYYTFGHLETALIQNATRSSTRWSYNLMCATIPALCVSALFALGAALTGRLAGGGFVAFVVLFLGTLQPIFQWRSSPEWQSGQVFSPAFWYSGQFLRLDGMGVSRVLPNAINEFPFFTFNQGDLHAHYFSFTFQIAAICVALTLFLRFSWKRAAVAAAVLGALILTNTWDFPTYFLLVAFSIFTVKSAITSRRVNIVKRFGAVFFVLATAILLALPFLLRLSSAAGGPKPLPQPASPLREWLMMWGIFTGGWWCFAAYGIFKNEKHWRIVLLALGAGVLLVARRAEWGYPPSPWSPSDLAQWKAISNPARIVLPLIVVNIGLAIAGIFTLSRPAPDEKAADSPTSRVPLFLCLMALCGLISLLIAETTWSGFLGDINNPGFDDFKRQDTVFKFGLQTWFLWGTAVATGAFLTFRQWFLPLKIVVVPVLLVMAISSLAAAGGRTKNFQQRDYWDAWAHLAPEEKAAATWLEASIRPNENILEAEQKEGGDYSVYTRYTHATGIPTIIGPQAHSFQWSPANSKDAGKEWDEVFKRKNNAREIFLNPTNRAGLLRMYGVKYIVWGELEREQYGASGYISLTQDSGLESVAHFGSQSDPHYVEIFRVNSL